MVNGPVTAELKAALGEVARRLGFVACGIARADEDPLRAARLDDWLASGAHGQMEWMEGRAHHRRTTEEAFGDVLAQLKGAARERHLNALIAVTDVYVWQLFRRDMGLDQKAVTAQVLETVNKLNAAVTGTAASPRSAS